jgi:hypothetical protein
MIELLAGNAIIHDNSFQHYRQQHIQGYWNYAPVPTKEGRIAVRIGPGVNDATIHGNLLNGNKVENNTGRTAALISENQP